jgi:hypothetical protein
LPGWAGEWTTEMAVLKTGRSRERYDGVLCCAWVLAKVVRKVEFKPLHVMEYEHQRDLRLLR